MQDRSGIVGEAHTLLDDDRNDESSHLMSPNSNDSKEIFAQSALELNIETHRLPESLERPTISDEKSNLSRNVLSLEAIKCPLKPKILYITPETSAVIGESVCLEVEFRANPLSKTKIVWFKKDIAVEESERIKILDNERMSTLIIEDVMDCDSGRYEIEVLNELGADRANTSLQVKGPPEPPGKPSILVSDNCLRLSWSLPAYDGGSRLIGYKIDMKSDFSDWITLTDECNCNWYGISRASEPSDIVRPLENKFSQNMSQSDDDSEPRNVVVEKNSKFNEVYDTKEEIGRGRFGVCKRVVERSGQKEKAAKFIRCLRAKDKEQVYGEIDIMNRLRHKHLLRLDAAFELTKEIILITEYISGGELFERIVADDYILTEFECIVFMRQICEAVSYMHSNNIIHLDLKPENILCKTRTSYEIKIIDFGLARVYDKNETIKIMFGTPEFVAPEIVNYDVVTPAADMWSIGVICYVLLSGLSPFMDETDAKTLCNVTQAEYDFDDEAFDNISEEAKQFVSLLLVKKPDKRLSADDCLSNRWLRREPSNHNQIPTQKLKKYLIQRKWQRTGTAIRALARITNLGLARGVGRQQPLQPSDSSLK